MLLARVRSSRRPEKAPADTAPPSFLESPIPGGGAGTPVSADAGGESASSPGATRAAAGGDPASRPADTPGGRWVRPPPFVRSWVGGGGCCPRVWRRVGFATERLAEVRGEFGVAGRPMVRVRVADEPAPVDVACPGLMIMLGVRVT